jgi:predicted component of type VI protein secretion system
MEARLVVDLGRQGKKTLHIHATETIIGRRRNCGVRIKSSEVSRRHCLISKRDGYLAVEDLESVNGTYINGTRVVGKQLLRPGDHLEIGPLSFVVEYEMTQAVLDRLESSATKDEGIDVLQVIDEQENLDMFALPPDEELDAIPLAADDSRELGHPGKAEERSIPVEDELGEVADWKLPQSNDLRNILSNLEDSRPKRRRGKED